MKLFKALVLIIFMSVSTLVLAEDYSVENIKNMDAKELVNLLNNDDWQIRDSAIVYGLRKYRMVNEKGIATEFKSFDGEEEIKTALISLLEKEITLRKTGKRPITKGEGYGEYLLDLVSTVTYIKDLKALPVLVETIGGKVGQSHHIGKAIANFGEPAIDPVISKLKDKNNQDRSDAAFVLENILEKRKEGKLKISNDGKNKIKKVLIESLQDDKNKYVRIHAVKGLGSVEDKDVIPILKSIPKTDPEYKEVEKILKQMEQK